MNTGGAMNNRGSGVLLHVTSLPSAFGIGDLGPGAYKFVDFLSQTKQHYWQFLPINPIDPSFGYSPYSSISAFAGNTLFISPEVLVADGLLSKDDLASVSFLGENHCDYAAVVPYKEELLNWAYLNFKNTRANKIEFEHFCMNNSYWLEDFALFVVLKEILGGRSWNEWPEEYKDREEGYLDAVRHKHADELEKVKFLQYIFNKQWHWLKGYCQQKGVRMIGDIPIYVSYDSADVWTHPRIFKLDENKKASFVAGVPPDYFSQTGQLWGNPVYSWEALRETGYQWFLERFAHNLELFDVMRIDHFRGFVAFWEVAVVEKTAVKGRWMSAPAYDFFNVLINRFGRMPIIAEDLGIITDDVREVMRHFAFPGMRVLLFAFGDDSPTHPYLPHNYVQNCVVYTGTHDNNTARGWFDSEAASLEKERLFRCVGHEVSSESVNWELIQLAMRSIANTVIIPMQDILGLGAAARMNQPAQPRGNWVWRLKLQQLSPDIEKMLADITETSGR